MKVIYTVVTHVRPPSESLWFSHCRGKRGQDTTLTRARCGEISPPENFRLSHMCSVCVRLSACKIRESISSYRWVWGIPQMHFSGTTAVGFSFSAILSVGPLVRLRNIQRRGAIPVLLHVLVLYNVDLATLGRTLPQTYCIISIVLS